VLFRSDAVHAEGRRALHGRERSVQRLIDCAQRTVARGGFLLLPSFGLGRAQELVTIIDAHRGRELPDGPLYVAGLGRRVMDVYDDYSGEGGGGWASVGSFPAVRDPAEWLTPEGTFAAAAAEIVHGEAPGYIVAAPAMLSGGWSRPSWANCSATRARAWCSRATCPATGAGSPASAVCAPETASTWAGGCAGSSAHGSGSRCPRTRRRVTCTRSPSG